MKRKKNKARATPSDDRRFRLRATLSLVVVALCFVGLSSRLFYLQILQHEEFSTRSENNRVKVRPVAPARGLIYDRNGILLGFEFIGAE